MPTNLAIDDKLIMEALEIGHHKTKKEAVTIALREYIQRRKQLRLLELKGQVEYEADYDYKTLRRNASATARK